MIIEYDETGRIFHMISDPVPPSMIDLLTEKGHTFLNLPPVELPDEPLLDEDGNQKVDRQITQLFNEDGTPQKDANGEELYQVVETPLFLTNRFQSVSFDWLTDYVKDGQLVPRPTVSVPETAELVVGQTGVVENLPKPCRILVDGEEHVLEDGELEIEATMPAEYTIVFDQWPYIPATMKVTVREA